MKMYDLKTEDYAIRCIPFGEEPFCVAYIGMDMVTVEDWERERSLRYQEGDKRAAELLAGLYHRMQPYFADCEEKLYKHMIDLRKYEITEVDEQFIQAKPKEEIPEEEDVPEAAVIATPEQSPSERWFQYQCDRIDAVLDAVRKDREEEARRREEKEQEVIAALEKERTKLRPILEFHIPETGPQLDMFGEVSA